MAAASARHAGRVIDNCLDVVRIILRTACDNAPPPCMPSSLAIKEITETPMFGDETRIVGLGPTAYALTDGETKQFNGCLAGTVYTHFCREWQWSLQAGEPVCCSQR
jgi:hypothetical protein